MKRFRLASTTCGSNAQPAKLTLVSAARAEGTRPAPSVAPSAVASRKLRRVSMGLLPYSEHCSRAPLLLDGASRQSLHDKTLKQERQDQWRDDRQHAAARHQRALGRDVGGKT